MPITAPLPKRSDPAFTPSSAREGSGVASVTQPRARLVRHRHRERRLGARSAPRWDRHAPGDWCWQFLHVRVLELELGEPAAHQSYCASPMGRGGLLLQDHLSKPGGQAWQRVWRQSVNQLALTTVPLHRCLARAACRWRWGLNSVNSWRAASRSIRVPPPELEPTCSCRQFRGAARFPRASSAAGAARWLKPAC